MDGAPQELPPNPGAPPRTADPTRLDAALSTLELTVRRRLDGLLQGDYRSLFYGYGLDFADLREYQPQDDVRTMLAEYKRRRDNLHPEIASIPGVRCLRPEGAFYFWLNVEQRLGPSLPTTLALASRFLVEQKVAVVPGEGFSAPGYLRISFARSLTDLQDGVARLRTFLGARR